MRTKENSLALIIMTGLSVTVVYLGVWILRVPVLALVGRPFTHFDNTLAAVAILYLEYRNEMLVGIIGLGGFDLLSDYAATSWLAMFEVVIVASVLTAAYRGMHYQDSKRNIIILRIIAGITKVSTTYHVLIVEALMVGTSLNVALVNSFVSSLAAVINSILTAICMPILYSVVRDGAKRVLGKSV